MCPIDWRRQYVHATKVTAVGREHAKALGVTPGTVVCLDVPLPSQAHIEELIAAFRQRYPEKRFNLTWGGQAGPGKSHGIRRLLYRRALATPHHESLLLRENWEQLEKTHIRRMHEELPKMGARVVDRTAVFPNGAFIDCGHMADKEAIGRYLSTGYGVIAPDEASLYPVDADGTPVLAELATRARESWVGLDHLRSVPLFIPTTNPGGPSAHWLLDMCIDHTPDLERFPALGELTDEGEPVYNPDHWQYYAARLDDNPYMREDYAATDLATVSKFRYEQLRHGDWHVFSGQFFSEWSERQHVATIDVPSGVRWFRSMDWGYNAPGCVLWWAVLADGHLYIRSELKFQRKDVSVVRAEIRERDKELGVSHTIPLYGDPAMQQKIGQKTKRGESIAESLGLSFIPGDNDRYNGWMRCHQILRNDALGVPWLQVHPDCRYLIRSLPAALSDAKDPDDVDTTGDDHALDAWRYGAMSRPAPRSVSTVITHVEGTLGYYKARNQKPGGPLARRTRAA